MYKLVFIPSLSYRDCKYQIVELVPKICSWVCCYLEKTKFVITLNYIILYELKTLQFEIWKRKHAEIIKKLRIKNIH